MAKRLTVLLAAVGLHLAGLQVAFAADTVTLRMLSAWPESQFYSKGAFVWMDAVKKELGERVKLDFKGGPEVIPAFKQVEAIKNGAIDVTFTTPAYYATNVPQAIVLGFTQLPSKTLWDNGAIEHMNGLLAEKANARIVATFWNYSSATFTTKPVSSMADLKGRKIRTGSFIPFLTALGAEPIRIPLGEVFTSLERGVLDGMTSPEVIADKSIRSLLKYKVLPTYYDVNFDIIMSKRVWDGLPKDVQEGLHRAGLAAEAQMANEVEKLTAEANSQAKSEGMQEVHLSDGNAYLKLAYDSAWGFVHQKMPADAPQLEKLFR